MAKTTLHSHGGNKSRIMAALSYLGVLCFVPLIMNKDDEFVYFHSKQGLVIWIWGVLAVFALHLPGIGKWLFSVSALAVVCLSVIGICSVLFNRAWKLPFVHNIAAAI